MQVETAPRGFQRRWILTPSQTHPDAPVGRCDSDSTTLVGRILASRGLTDPAAFLAALDKVVPRYLDLADNGVLVYPACKRKPGDLLGDARAVWEHTRLEAMRYIPMVPRKEPALLVDPASQAETIDAFLRQRAHDSTVVDFTGTAIEDYGIAIYAALNWLNHCGAIVNADPQKFSGTLRSFHGIDTSRAKAESVTHVSERVLPMCPVHTVAQRSPQRM